MAVSCKSWQGLYFKTQTCCMMADDSLSEYAPVVDKHSPQRMTNLFAVRGLKKEFLVRKHLNKKRFIRIFRQWGVGYPP